MSHLRATIHAPTRRSAPWAASHVDATSPWSKDGRAGTSRPQARRVLRRTTIRNRKRSALAGGSYHLNRLEPVADHVTNVLIETLVDEQADATSRSQCEP